MTRFNNLEFDSEQPKKDQPSGASGPAPAAGAPVRDERYYLEQALRHRLGGDFETALRLYSRALEQRHNLLAAWLGQLEMLLDLGEYPEVLLWGDRALEVFPEHPDVFAAKARACVRDERPVQGQEYSDNAMNQGKSGWVWLARGEVMLARRSGVAQSCLGNALAAGGSETPLVRLEAGRILNHYHQHRQALEYLPKAVAELPQSALAWYEFGLAQCRLGLSPGREALEQALALRPEWPVARQAWEKYGKKSFFGRLFGRR